MLRYEVSRRFTLLASLPPKAPRRPPTSRFRQASIGLAVHGEVDELLKLPLTGGFREEGHEG